MESQNRGLTAKVLNMITVVLVQLSISKAKRHIVQWQEP